MDTRLEPKAISFENSMQTHTSKIMSVSMFDLLWVKLSFWSIGKNDYQDYYPDNYNVVTNEKLLV